MLALIAAAALYAPTLHRGLVNLDDPWLVRDNWILAHPSWASVHTVLFDLHSAKRFTIAPEYLPVRDLSIMFDSALWGTWYPGFHLTNLALYLASIALWIAVLDGFGVDRRVAGLAMLLWALHPSHAESVAWISERKGLLAMAFAGACGVAYVRYRAGGSARWLALAATCAVCAVWSKAFGAFALAGLAGLEVALPARRVSVRRSLAGLGAIALASGAAVVPVLALASSSQVVGRTLRIPGGRVEAVLGIHGFYLRLGALALRDAVAYPISQLGPSGLDIALGAVGLAAMLVAASGARGRVPPEVRAGALWWLVAWLPISNLVLPLQMVFVADRYLLGATLGLALIAAAALVRIPSTRARRALIGAIALAAGLRACDAQANWRDSRTLWQRAVESDPYDGDAWSMYADALADAGQPERAAEAVMIGLRHTSSPRLVLREALLALDQGERSRGEVLMQRAAQGGEPRAMGDLAVLLQQDGKLDDALAWGRRVSAAAPMYENGQRVHGTVALAAGRAGEALAAFERARALHPDAAANELDVALALTALHRAAEARPLLAACAADPTLGARCRAALAGSSR